MVHFNIVGLYDTWNNYFEIHLSSISDTFSIRRVHLNWPHAQRAYLLGQFLNWISTNLECINREMFLLNATLLMLGNNTEGITTYTYVRANWIDMSRSNSPTVAISSGFQSPFGCDTSRIKSDHFSGECISAKRRLWFSVFSLSRSFFLLNFFYSSQCTIWYMVRL